MFIRVCFSILILLIGTFVRVDAQIDKIRALKTSLPKIQDSLQYVDVLNRISLLFYEQNPDSTLYYGARARDIANRLDYAKGKADATNNLGIVFDIKGNPQLALRYYNDAFIQYQAIRDTSNIVQTLMNIGTVYDLSDRPDKAEAHLRQALELGNKLAHDSITALVIYNYLMIFPKSFNASERSNYLEKASRIAAKYKDLRIQLGVEQLRAHDLMMQGEEAKGVALLRQTLQKSLDMELHFFSMDLFAELGDFYRKSQPDSTLYFYKKGMQVSTEKSYRIYATLFSKRIYEYYQARKDYKNASVYSRMLVKLYEEQAEIDRVSGIDYIDYAVKDQELRAEKRDAQYNERLLILAVVICMLTLLSIVFLYRNWTLSRKTNEVLSRQFRQLELVTEALETGNRNYARVIKMVAHDLRNPIGGIQAISNMLKEESLSGEEAKEAIRLIHDSSRNCMTLIGDLLKTDFEISEADLQKERINLRTFLQQSVKLLTFRANEKNQDLILNEATQVTLLADQEKLLRVFNNLVVNAIKFSPEGARIEVESKMIHNEVVISIRDFGIGIPKGAMPQLFDPFTAAKRKGTAGEQPFGLGLYISKQIIEAHHGRIWFESEEGKGTTFHIALPAETEPHATLQNA